MDSKTSKKSLLALATALIPASTTLLSQGRYLEGGILASITVFLFIGYDHIDDRYKGELKLPEGVDAEMVEDVVEQVASDLNERR